MVSLVRCPFRGKGASGAGQAAVKAGEAELPELQQSPGDRQKAVALAEVLLARAAADSGFDRALKGWRAQAEPVRETIGNLAPASDRRAALVPNADRDLMTWLMIS